jgi:hypothetical protein
MMLPTLSPENRISLMQSHFSDNDKEILLLLCGVDKFEPVSGWSDVDHAEEGFGELVVSGCDCPVDFQVSEHALDAVALFVQGAVVLDRHTPV